MSSSVGARRVATPSVRVGMVLCAGGMRLIVLGRSTRFRTGHEPVPEAAYACWNNEDHVRADPG